MSNKEGSLVSLPAILEKIRAATIVLSVFAHLPLANAETPSPVTSMAMARHDVSLKDKHRGMCYAHALGPEQGYGSAASAASLCALAAMGVN